MNTKLFKVFTSWVSYLGMRDWGTRNIEVLQCFLHWQGPAAQLSVSTYCYGMHILSNWHIIVTGVVFITDLNQQLLSQKDEQTANSPTHLWCGMICGMFEL